MKIDFGTTEGLAFLGGFAGVVAITTAIILRVPIEAAVIWPLGALYLGMMGLPVAMSFDRRRRGEDDGSNGPNSPGGRDE